MRSTVFIITATSARSRGSYFSTYSIRQSPGGLVLTMLLQFVVCVILGSAGTGATDPDTEICVCPCYAAKLNLSTEAATTVEDANTKAEELEKELTVDKKSTSTTTRSKVSIMDDRPSANYIGVAGIVFISVVAACILVLDIGSMRKDMKKPTPKKGSKKRKTSQGGGTDGKPNADSENTGSGISNQTDVNSPSKGVSGSAPSPDRSYYNNYLTVPYSTMPLLANGSPTPSSSSSWDRNLDNVTGTDDDNRSISDRGSGTIRIRALKAPYGSTA